MKQPERIGAIVVGAGVIGLACARNLALRGIETLIVERHDSFGNETSARNSEVIHAGLYYPSESLKARLCVQGRKLLYDFCISHGIAHRRCGKLIVATSLCQEVKLEALYRQGIANGVDDLQALTRAEVQILEPALRCTSALLSPSTGIIDSHALMLALLGDAERHGALLAVQNAVRGGYIEEDGIVLEIGDVTTNEITCLKTGLLINAAGLSAVPLAASLEGFPTTCLPPCFYAKGNYYTLAGRSPFSRLIYPLPEHSGLGVHLTLDLAGQARFGPDVEWVDVIDYPVDPKRADSFYAAIRRYWPDLPNDSLAPAYAGIRPKIVGPNASAADFLIQGQAEHGIPKLVNLFGIESPGLTACLAIASEVMKKLGLLDD